MDKSRYGTSGGVELTDELIERLAREAEEGYDVERLLPRPIGSSTHQATQTTDIPIGEK